jgi:hypothetical protein
MFYRFYHCFIHISLKKYLWIAMLALFSILMVACKDAQVNGEGKNPYTVEEVRRMMAYHGALAARFDGGQWWALAKGGWVRIESGGAYRYALLSRGQETDRL